MWYLFIVRFQQVSFKYDPSTEDGRTTGRSGGKFRDATAVFHYSGINFCYRLPVAVTGTGDYSDLKTIHGICHRSFYYLKPIVNKHGH